MDDAKQQLIDRLQKANNILVTVSRDPSVDQLASCIGLTLLLNKQGKHTAAVFSGKVPSTLEFLEPDKTLEKNTDSLRDFIISLDKSKADKLRYKVEQDVVRIFITPYKTSLSADDLEFSEGDFNVDVVVALGVQNQDELDQAITTHGRILHDATVTSINTAAEGGLGNLNWHNPQASSLSEMVTELGQALGSELLDQQIATALLTGIISSTGRFSNERTSSQTMSASAALLQAGANQQLVATKLEEKPKPEEKKDEGPQDDQPDQQGKDGVLEIDHLPVNDGSPGSANPLPPPPAPKPPAAGPSSVPPPSPTPEKPQEPTMTQGAKIMTQPPTLGGTLTANSRDQALEPVTDPLSMPTVEAPMLEGRGSVDKPAEPKPAPALQPPEPVTPPSSPAPVPPAPEPPAPTQHITPPPPGWTPPPSNVPPATPIKPADTDHSTLSDIEKSVNSPHVSESDLQDVRDKVSEALNGSDAKEPIQALNAQPLGDDLHTPAPSAPLPPPPAPDTKPNEKKDDDAPPPVPPPIPFQFGNSPPSS